jgi:hypothetical protein
LSAAGIRPTVAGSNTVPRVKLPRGRGSLGERLASLAGVDPKRAALLGEVGRRAARAVDAVQPHLRTARDLRDRWGGHPLFFLLRRLPLAQAGQLLRLVDEAGEEIVVELAAPVITSSTLVAVLHEELLFVADLDPAVRRQLLHGLRHAEAGEWEDACPPLVIAMQHLGGGDPAEPRAAAATGNLPARSQGPTALRVLERARPLAERTSPLLERAGSWARGALAQGRTSQTYRLGGDARRQAVFLVAELVRWLERSGQDRSAQLLIRELARAVRSERERRQPRSRQLRQGRENLLEAANDESDPTSER